MFRLLRKLYGWALGCHVCEEFTQWVKKSEDVQLITRINGIVVGDPVDVTQRWQERRCTICGRVFQSPLHFG